MPRRHPRTGVEAGANIPERASYQRQNPRLVTRHLRRRWTGSGQDLRWEDLGERGLFSVLVPHLHVGFGLSAS